VTDVFSTYLWSGDQTARSIDNGIDLDGEGGMVWVKARTYTDNHTLQDTVRGAGKHLRSNGDTGQGNEPNTITSFNSNGFSISYDDMVNGADKDYVSWAWRKTEKFFDVVTYTGTGSAQAVSHNLGSVPGMMIVKKLNAADEWYVYHRNIGNTGNVYLNVNIATNTSQAVWNNTSPTSTHFTVGTVNGTNQDGGSYVAYLFAHHDGDGEFGPNSDQDIIHCGTYTTNGSGLATVNLGFEPQWMIAKRTNGTQDWGIFDVSRGIFANNDYIIKSNVSNAESSAGNQYNVTPTGFTCQEHNPSATYVFMAIRRGPLAPPENVDDVFSQTAFSGNGTDDRVITSGFQTDFVIHKRRDSAANWFVANRLQGEKGSLYQTFLNLTTEADDTQTNRLQEIALQDGVQVGTDSDVNGSGATYSNYQWKRAPKFFEMVSYKGNGTAGRVLDHGLGVEPSMVWVKKTNNARDWGTGFDALGWTKRGPALNSSEIAYTTTVWWNDTAPTATQITLGQGSTVNGSNDQYIMYLFADLTGISKAGAISHTSGSATNVDCGFSNGARFVILKRYDAASDWWVFDTERGIVAGNDSRLFFNNTNAENTGSDEIDPYSAGFSIASGRATGNYLFYAIAT